MDRFNYFLSEDELEQVQQLKKAWNEAWNQIIDVLAKDFRLYQIADWIDLKIEKIIKKIKG